MSAVKRLTPPQSRKVNALIKRECCNCVGGNCLLLDDGVNPPILCKHH